MNWRIFQQDKPIINQRVLVVINEIVYSARFVIEESYSDRFLMEEFFLVDCVMKKESPRYGYENRVYANFLVYWIPIEELSIPV